MDNSVFKSFAKGQKTIRLVSNDCVIYTRVSGIKQLDGLSLETQLKATKAYAQKHNLNIKEHFGGTYESALTDERKEFQRMIKYLKTSKYKISQVLVYSLERFSRNDNSIWLSKQLRALNIEVVSVTQPIDTSTPAGIMQQSILFLFGEFDNQLRRQKSMAGTRERLLKGEWCSSPPVGYDIVWTKGVRTIVLNQQSKIIKKIFVWKAQERLNNEEIRKRLLNLKVQYNLRRIAEILTNPFYCGLLAHKALEGEIIEGKHEKLISKEVFLEVNNLMAKKKTGLMTKKERPEVALKRFAKCEICNQGLRGYISKEWNLLYYKCQTQGCNCNRNALELNRKFEVMLDQYKVNSEYIELIRYELKHIFTEMNESLAETHAAAKTQVSDLNRKLERLEERFVLEELAPDTYYKYKGKFEAERDKILDEIKGAAIELSKLDEVMDFTLSVSANLSEMWRIGDYTQRQELQNVFFPEGITYNRRKDECRSVVVNEFIERVAEMKGQIVELYPEKMEVLYDTSLRAS